MKTVDIIYRYETRNAPARPRPPDSDAAIQRLNHGNQAFAALLDSVRNAQGPVQQIVPLDARDLGLLSDNKVPQQQPFAIVLGCSDARVPIELIFNEGPNDLFVVRVAGNGLGTEVVGSLKYAVEHLGGSLRLVVVLGHSGCGAVKAAVDVFLNPAGYLPLATSHALRNILDRLLLVVQTSARKLSNTFGADVTRHPGYRDGLIETATVTNAALAAYSIQQEIGPSLRAAYGIYRLETREVWAPRPGGPDGNGLVAPPNNLNEFVALGDAIVQSRWIASHINPGTS